MLCYTTFILSFVFKLILFFLAKKNNAIPYLYLRPLLFFYKKGYAITYLNLQHNTTQLFCKKPLKETGVWVLQQALSLSETAEGGHDSNKYIYIYIC